MKGERVEETVLKLEGFQNLVGHHCSSSALRSVLHYDGIEVSEALAFGLGSGLGFFYAVEPQGSPTRRFNGRAPDLEGNFYRLAGAALEWVGEWQPERILESLSENRPVLAQTDIFPIPYYDDAHFIGHGVAVVGLIGDEVLVADIAAPGFSKMTLQNFHDAVAPAHYPLLTPFSYAAAPKLSHLDVEEIAPRAVAKTAAYMLTPPTALEGVPGIFALADDLPNWLDLPDLAWAARFGYQAIEKRGTGGGGFRYLYRDFLEEVQPHVGFNPTLLRGFAEAGDLWREVADILKHIAFAQTLEAQRRGLSEVQAKLYGVGKLEARLFNTLRS